jgi:SulP family sulfate permease
MRTLSRPLVRELGRLPGTDTFVPLDRFPAAERVPGLALLRPEGPVFFANANVVRDRVRALAGADPRPAQVMLNLDGTSVVGVVLADALADLARDLGRFGVTLALCNVRGEIREFLDRSGALAAIGPERVHESQRAGVRAYEAGRVGAAD